MKTDADAELKQLQLICYCSNNQSFLKSFPRKYHNVQSLWQWFKYDSTEQISETYDMFLFLLWEQTLRFISTQSHTHGPAAEQRWLVLQEKNKLNWATQVMWLTPVCFSFYAEQKSDGQMWLNGFIDTVKSHGDLLTSTWQEADLCQELGLSGSLLTASSTLLCFVSAAKWHVYWYLCFCARWWWMSWTEWMFTFSQQ